MLKRYRIYDWWWNRRRHRTPRNDPPRGVLLISSGGLGDTVLFAHVVERFVALAQDNEPVDVLLRSDAMKMAFLLPSNVSAIGVEFERLRRDMVYRREVTDNLFDTHYRLLVHTDYLRQSDEAFHDMDEQHRIAQPAAGNQQHATRGSLRGVRRRLWFHHQS